MESWMGGSATGGRGEGDLELLALPALQTLDGGGLRWDGIQPDGEGGIPGLAMILAPQSHLPSAEGSLELWGSRSRFGSVNRGGGEKESVL